MSDGAKALTMYEQRRLDKMERQRKKFLQELAKTGKIAHSARYAGYVDASALQKHKRESPEFAAAWMDAEMAARESFQDELIRRGVEGVDKPLVYKGEIVGYEKEYSDSCLMLLMKGTYRERYGDSMQVSGAISHSIGVAILPMTAQSPEEWERGALEVRANQALLVPPVKEEEKVRAPELVRR